MADRYFCEAPITTQHAELVGPEAHHLAHVMRAKSGTQVTLFDGSGVEFAAQVQRVGRSTIELSILEQTAISRELERHITLAVALPKGDRQRWLVEKLTELGAARLIPLITHRGIAQPFAGAISKLQRAVIEASKQCGRNRLMEISEPQTLSDYISTASRDAANADGTPAINSRWIAHPTARLDVDRQTSFSTAEASGTQSEASSTRPEGSGTRNRSMEFAVGPEGGFTADEIDMATAAGWQTVDLGARILRVETAALALMAIAAIESFTVH